MYSAMYIILYYIVFLNDVFLSLLLYYFGTLLTTQSYYNNIRKYIVCFGWCFLVAKLRMGYCRPTRVLCSYVYKLQYMYNIIFYRRSHINLLWNRVNIPVSVTHNKSALSSGVFPFFWSTSFFFLYTLLLHRYTYTILLYVFTTCTVLASRWYQFLDRIVHGITPYISL